MVNGILDYLWLVPALPLVGVVVNGLLALFAERPLLLKEAACRCRRVPWIFDPWDLGLAVPRRPDSHGHGGGSHGHHGTPMYRKLVALIAPGVIGASFVVALLCVLSLAARPAEGRTFVQILFPGSRRGRSSPPWDSSSTRYPR